MKPIFKDTYLTKLGCCELDILSNDLESKSAISISEESNKVNFVTKSYAIEVSKQSLNLELVNGARLSERIAWCFYLQKTTNQPERLKIRFELKATAVMQTCGPDSGQHLDAMEYSDLHYQIHIGTEDGEAQMTRAPKSDWLPKRYAKYYYDHSPQNRRNFYSFTAYTKNGFLIRVPNLRVKEQAYFHFILAGKIYEAHNADTWLAVDVSKEELLTKYPNIKQSAYGI